MQEKPLVTIVIPTYNRLALVLQAIQSVIGQTYHNWQLIVVDDGSDDGTDAAIHSIQDSRVRVLEMQHSGNIAKLRNAGAAAGTGEWLAFLDSDDVWLPQKLEIQLAQVQIEKKRWSYGAYELVDHEMRTIPNKAGVYHAASGWITKALLTTEVSVHIGSLLLERSLFEDTGRFNEHPDLLFREDYEFALRLSLKAEALAVSELLVRVREHAGRSTHAFQEGHDRTAFVYRYFISTKPGKEFISIARQRMAFELAESACNQMRQKQYLSGTGKLMKAFIHGDKWRHLLSSLRRGLFY